MTRRSALTLIVLFSALTLACAQAPQPQQASLAVGHVTIFAIKGEVTIKSPAGDTVSAAKGQGLLPGTIIETAKGSTVLNLHDGSQVQVKPHSRVTLTDPAEQKHFSLELFLGNLLAKIRKSTTGAPSFRMGTPTAVITVRGTEFSVDVNKKGRTAIEVYDGIVEVSGMLPNIPPVLIGPGFRTDVEPNRAPQRPSRFGASPNDDNPFNRRSSSAGDDSSPGRRTTGSSDSSQQSGSSQENDR